MDIQTIIQEEINKSVKLGLTPEMSETYIADALELAFVKTLAKRVDALPEDIYAKILAYLEQKDIATALDILFAENDTGIDIDEKIFALHLKEAFKK
jgi:Mg/Co/Ni transporter MgtE